jgi:hypothetical protein
MATADEIFQQILRKDRRAALMLFYRYGIAGYQLRSPGWIAQFFDVTAREVKELTDNLVAEILQQLHVRAMDFEAKSLGKGSKKTPKTARGRKTALSLVKGTPAPKSVKRR